MYNMTFYEMKNSVVVAYANFEASRMRELEQMDKNMFEDVIRELEEEMEFILNRFWED